MCIKKLIKILKLSKFKKKTIIIIMKASAPTITDKKINKLLGMNRN